MRKVATALLAAAAVTIWGSSRLTWLTADVFDDKSGDATYPLVGAVWSSEMTAIALVLLAAVVATLALRRPVRRIVAAIATLAAAAASWRPLELLLYGADPLRLKSLLTSGAASQRQSDPISITQWAQITNISVSHFGPVLAIIGCALGVFGGVLMVLRPGTDKARGSAYETRKVREEKLDRELAEEPDSPRLMWDALDAEIDPTTKDA